MRELASKEKIIEFMRLLGRRSHNEVRVYFTGGTTAVLTGWRDSTIDIDLKFEPETDELFRALPEIKEQLQIKILFPIRKEDFILRFRCYIFAIFLIIKDSFGTV